MDEIDDEEFSRRFFACSNAMQKIKLAVQHDRCAVVGRRDKPNLSTEFLKPVLDLPDSHPVTLMPASQDREGNRKMTYVKTTYRCSIMGKPLEIFLKGYFLKTGEFVSEFLAESLREDKE